MAERALRVAPLTTRQIGWRLFLTAWLVYGLHFATDIVREHYPALALGDHFSFTLDGYCGLHPDLFETPGRGCHIGNNPGVSMLAAIPYALARPLIDPVVARVQAARQASGRTEPPGYKTEWTNSRQFYLTVWQRGLDIKLGLAAFVMQFFCMAPSSALGVVLIFLSLRAVLGGRDGPAMWLSLLYAFGTPVFFRTGFLNHNMMLGHIAFAGFLAVWNPWNGDRLTTRTRDVLCGLGAGAAILFDYSGAVFIVTLFAYVVARRWQEGGVSEALRGGFAFFLGTLPGVLLLWFYQWKAFGNPFLPGQHWMPPVEYVDRGYRGYQFPPDPGLIGSLLFDLRFGLFVSAPILLLALAMPWINRRRAGLAWLDQAALLGIPLAMLLFFAGNNYTRLQFNTGIRYLSPILPFLFVPAAMVLVRMRPRTAYAWAVVAVMISWPLAMYREVERPLGVLDPVFRTLSAGFALPALSTLSQTTGQYGDFFIHGVSPLPLFVATGAVLYGLWAPQFRRGLPS